MRFNHDLHTVEARGVQIGNILEVHPDALLMGSVARAAILGNEAPVRSGRTSVRDLDFTTTSGAPLELTEADQQPFPVDDLLPGLISLPSGSSDTAKIMFESTRPDVAVELPSGIFEPYSVEVGGVKAETFHPDVLRHLHLIMNSNRRKDKRNIAAFTAGLQGVEYTKIPESTFDPLHELGRMVLNDPQLRRQRTTDRLQEIYSGIVPDAVRNGLKPMVRAIKNSSLVSSRY